MAGAAALGVTAAEIEPQPFPDDAYANLAAASPSGRTVAIASGDWFVVKVYAVDALDGSLRLRCRFQLPAARERRAHPADRAPCPLEGDSSELEKWLKWPASDWATIRHMCFVGASDTRLAVLCSDGQVRLYDVSGEEAAKEEIELDLGTKEAREQCWYADAFHVDPDLTSVFVKLAPLGNAATNDREPTVMHFRVSDPANPGIERKMDVAGIYAPASCVASRSGVIVTIVPENDDGQIDVRLYEWGSCNVRSFTADSTRVRKAQGDLAQETNNKVYGMPVPRLEEANHRVLNSLWKVADNKDTLEAALSSAIEERFSLDNLVMFSRVLEAGPVINLRPLELNLDALAFHGAFVGEYRVFDMSPGRRLVTTEAGKCYVVDLAGSDRRSLIAAIQAIDEISSPEIWRHIASMFFYGSLVHAVLSA